MAKRFSTKSLTKQVNKWTSGYYSSGYKTPGKTSYSNSSFWMDDDFLTTDRDFTGKDVKPSLDYVKLAGYKRAIANFVKIVTNKDNIPVKFSSGEQSYTDGSTVVISSKLDEKEFDSTVGLALHEGSHIALTDFKLTNTMLGYSSTFIALIEEWHRVTFPEQSGYLYTGDIIAKVKALTNIIEDRRIDKFIYDSAPGYQGYYKSLYDKYFNADVITRALEEGTKCERTWEDYEFHICNFTNPSRQLNALPALQTIWNMIDIKNISRLKDTGSVIDLAGEVFKVIVEDIGGLYNKQTETNPEADPDEEDNGNGPGGSDINEVGDDTNDEMGGMGADPNMDMQGSNSSDSDTDAPEGAGDVDPKEAKRKAKEEKELEEAIQKQKDFLDGKIKKKNLTKKDAAKVNAAAESNMNYAPVGGDIPNDTGNTMHRGAKTNCMVVKGITSTLIESGLISGHLSDPSYRKNEIAKYGRKDYIAEGIALGTLLGKRLKTRDEERSIKTTRLDAGRIDRRLVAELGFGNDKVFSQVLHSTVTPSIIHISIDASGSMSGNKWQSSMKTAVAIAKAATMVSNLDVVISIRGCYGSYGSGAAPLMFIAYDSRKDSFSVIKDKFYGLEASGSTPEGLCLQAVLDEIIKSSAGKDAYFINICDGEPGYSNSELSYGGDYAIQHTKAQVNKIRKAGIKVLAYFVSESCGYGSDRSMKKFREMYGKESEYIDLDNLVQLSNTLNKLFERNV